MRVWVVLKREDHGSDEGEYVFRFVRTSRIKALDDALKVKPAAVFEVDTLQEEVKPINLWEVS